MRHHDTFPRSTINTCMIDGKEQVYHICSEKRHFDTEDNFIYLGKGTIHKVDDVVQGFADIMHFWKRK